VEGGIGEVWRHGGHCHYKKDTRQKQEMKKKGQEPMVEKKKLQKKSKNRVVGTDRGGRKKTEIDPERKSMRLKKHDDHWGMEKYLRRGPQRANPGGSG